MKLDDLASLIALTEIQGIGDKRAYELFKEFESSEQLWTSPASAFEEFYYVDAETYAQFQGLPEIVDSYREKFRRYREEGIELIGIADDRYPASLRRHHAPLVLYAKGDTERISNSMVSVSGSRETNEAGREWVREMTRRLAADGLTIVSGGAKGTDTAAHRGALDETGATVVVLGTGVNTPYPEENASLFSDIVEAGGLLLSHCPPEAGPARHAFLDRNETISGLSPGILIAATDGSGGTMAQYKAAREQNRQIFVPTSDVDISPSDGLTELRSEADTIAVSSHSTIRTKLECVSVPKDEGAQHHSSAQDAVNQTQLGEWE